MTKKKKAEDPRYATTDGKPAREGFEDAAAPAPAKPDGQNEAYWVLSAEERSKGFVRPVRTSYKHVGIRPKHETRELTAVEAKTHSGRGYVLFEKYPENESSIVGRFWTQAQLDSGCGIITSMSLAIAETYARDPEFYGSTFCCGCQKHLAVEEFVWEGTEERVGS